MKEKSMKMIKVEHLSITYNKGTVIGVKDVSFSVDKGELFGLIGPDGAGKTSIFRMLTTLLLPDSGTAEVNDYDIVNDYEKIRSCVGYMPGDFSLYTDLTISENLEFFATVFGTTVEENMHLIDDIYKQIEPFKNRRAGKLSGGMKQKLALCCALIHKPVVLFLDEPTTGVDAVSRKEFWDMLKKLKKKGITILVSTPYMDEAKLCDRIALIQDGKIMSVETPRKIIAGFPDLLYKVKADDRQLLLITLNKYDEAIDSYAFGEYAHLVMERTELHEAMCDKIVEYLESRNLDNPEVKLTEPTVEDCFIRLMAGL